MVDIPLCSLISLWNLELNCIIDSHFQFRVDYIEFFFFFFLKKYPTINVFCIMNVTASCISKYLTMEKHVSIQVPPPALPAIAAF
jgi:hypothetical protein